MIAVDTYINLLLVPFFFFNRDAMYLLQIFNYSFSTLSFLSFSISNYQLFSLLDVISNENFSSVSFPLDHFLNVQCDMWSFGFNWCVLVDDECIMITRSIDFK